LIRAKDWDHTMFHLLEEETMGKYHLKKGYIPAGTQVTCYKEGVGMYKDKFTTPYPSVSIHQGGILWMSDTPFEQVTHAPSIRGARGRCLVFGLGLGYVSTMMAQKPGVQEVDTVDIDENIIQLIDGQLMKHVTTHPFLTKIHPILSSMDEYLEYAMKHDFKFDTVYADIWISQAEAMKQAEFVAQKISRVLAPEGRGYSWMMEHAAMVGPIPDKPMKQSETIGIHPPCKGCGKVLRFDYEGWCMDCADELGFSEMFK